MQPKFAMMWISVFVLSALASEKEMYTGDLGALILELVLKNTPGSLDYRSLCVCSGINKAVAKLYLPSKTKRLKLVHDTLTAQVCTLSRKELPDIVRSHEYPAIGYVSETVEVHPISDKYNENRINFTCLCLNNKSKAQENRLYKDKKTFKAFATKPQYMNGTFCFAYQCHDTIPHVAYINILGKQYGHPFPQGITLNSEETHALNTYFLRDICRVSYYADAIKNLGVESQYKLANLFACYASPKQMIDYVAYCCTKKSEYFLWLGTLKMSVIGERWEFENNPEAAFNGEAGLPSVFMQATLNKIDNLKKEKWFVKPEEQMSALPFKHRMQHWKGFIHYLNHKRITLKRCGDTILRYDDLSNTVRAISCIPREITVIDAYGKQSSRSSTYINKISKPVAVPKMVDVSTLTYTDDNRLKYALLTGDGNEKTIIGSLLSWGSSLVQDKNWIFSEKMQFLNSHNDIYIEEKV